MRLFKLYDSFATASGSATATFGAFGSALALSSAVGGAPFAAGCALALGGAPVAAAAFALALAAALAFDFSGDPATDATVATGPSCAACAVAVALSGGGPVGGPVPKSACIAADSVVVPAAFALALDLRVAWLSLFAFAFAALFAFAAAWLSLFAFAFDFAFYFAFDFAFDFAFASPGISAWALASASFSCGGASISITFASSSGSPLGGCVSTAMVGASASASPCT